MTPPTTEAPAQHTPVDTGGPAYPMTGHKEDVCPDELGDRWHEDEANELVSRGGMTVLDHFAGEEDRPSERIIEGLLLNEEMRFLGDESESKLPACRDTSVLVARWKYNQAQAMIAEKRRREGGAS